MDFQDFLGWKKKFLERNEGYYPKFEKSWFEKVEKNHEALRNFIGGEMIQRFYKLNSQQGKVDEKDCKHIIDQLLLYLPYYLEEYGYDRSVFLSPTVANGTHNIIRLGKHVRTYAEQRTREGTVSPENLKNIEKLLSELGQVWAKAKTSESELVIAPSTTERGFMLLGHYGPDPDSCFRQGSDKTQHKYIFAQTPHTFVITISKKHPKKPKQINVARCMGFANPSFTTFSLNNYYFLPKFPEGDALQCIRMLFEELWKDKAEFHEDIVRIDDYVFQNPSCNWCFSKGKDSRPTGYQLRSNIKNLRQFYCIKCGIDGGRESEFLEVDENPSCHRCFESAEECEESHRRTFNGLVELYDKENKVKMVHPDIAKEYSKCSKCNAHMALTHNIAGEDICFGCLETHYSECELCNQICEDSTIKDTGFIEVCEACDKLGLQLIGDQ